jgi:hypothetical protein
MLKQMPPGFPEYFLLKFTEEILRNSIKTSAKLKSPLVHHFQKTQIEERPINEPQKTQIEERPINEPQKIPLRKKFTRPISKETGPIFTKEPIQNKSLNIPRTTLPEHLQYMRPMPEELTMDLGSIDSLIRDPAVKIIECNGPDEKIIVKGAMGVKPTAITLREDEIESIINEFSQKSRIPIHEGIYHVAVGYFSLSTIISTVIPKKFIIKRMEYPQRINQGFLANAR